MSHWLYEGKELLEAPEGYFGFIYQITNLKSDKKYIGRKYFGSTRRVKVKGKTRRKVIRKDSNWKDYTGSSKELNKDIKALGKLHFCFKVLILGRTKGQVNYLEENIHHRFHVASNNNYYNDCIGPRRFGNVVIGADVKELITEIVG